MKASIPPSLESASILIWNKYATNSGLSYAGFFSSDSHPRGMLCCVSQEYNNSYSYSSPAGS